MLHHLLMAGIEHTLYARDKAFQTRFVFGLFNLIKLFAKLQLLHQKRRVAHGVLLAREIKPVERKQIFCTRQRMAQRLPGLVDGRRLRYRSQLLRLRTTGEFIRMVLTLQVLKTGSQRLEINRVLSG